MDFREEKDSMGSVLVPVTALYGAQTQRSLDNFKISTEKMPIEIVHAITYIKKAAAIVNCKMGLLDPKIREAIVFACNEVLLSKHDENFGLSVWQSGSGTQTHMNVNEVLTHLANQKLRGSKEIVHPNDHTNKSQSTNDVIPSALSIATVFALQQKLMPHLRRFQEALEDIAVKYNQELQGDFSPLAKLVQKALEEVEKALPGLYELAIGGSAIGTSLNTPFGFGTYMASTLQELTDYPFTTAPNYFTSIATMESFVRASAALKGVALAYMQVGNHIRLLASGPKCGVGVIKIPENEPGSSIMPGKVNPTQCEMLTQVAINVIGKDVAVSTAATMGYLDAFSNRCVVIYNLLNGIRLLSDAAANFVDKCVIGIEPKR